MGTLIVVGVIVLVLALDLAHVCLQPLPDRQGEHRPPVFLSLASPHDDLDALSA